MTAPSPTEARAAYLDTCRAAQRDGATITHAASCGFARAVLCTCWPLITPATYPRTTRLAPGVTLTDNGPGLGDPADGRCADCGLTQDNGDGTTSCACLDDDDAPPWCFCGHAARSHRLIPRTHTAPTPTCDGCADSYTGEDDDEPDPEHAYEAVTDADGADLPDSARTASWRSGR